MKYTGTLTCLTVLLALLMSGCGQNNNTVMAELEAKLAKERQLNEDLNEFLEQRMTQLEVRNGQLEDAFAALQASQDQVTELAANVSNEVAQVLKVEVEELIASKLDAQLGAKEDVGVALAGTIQNQIIAYEEKKEAERDAERERQRIETEERRAREREERLQKTVADLGLNEQQAQQLAVAESTLRTSMQDMFTAARESGTMNRDTMREKMGELREANTAILSQFMNAEQVEAYNEQNNRGFGGGPGGGRGGGGGGGGR